MLRTTTYDLWQTVCLLSLLALMVTGCVAVLSPQIRQEADRSTTFAQWRVQPEAYIGRLVIVGGDIVRTTHVPGALWLEVRQKPLDSQDTPLLTGQSEGHFIARCEQYLEPLVYTIGRAVTVAGRVLGTHTEKVGDADVVYPLLSCVEIYAWPLPVAVAPRYPGLWYWWEWDPWYWDPWYWHYHRHHHHHHHFRDRRPHYRRR